MDFLVSKISRNRMDALVSKYQTDKKTLEVGAFGSPSYSKFFKNRLGIDIRPGRGVDLVASVYDLPFKNDEFEVVLCLGVLEHLEEPIKAISEIKRVLKPGGRIIVSVPFLMPIHDAPNDFWRFTKFGLKKLFSEGWEIEKITAETDTQEFFATLIQRFGYQSKLRFNKFSKLIIFLTARIIENMPSIIKNIYGDINKKVEEPEAFTNAFFLVAKKS